MSPALPSPPPLDAGEAAIFLDVDGTLAPLRDDPAAVGPEARRSAMLTALADVCGGAVAAVSGRTLDDIDRILDARVRAVAGVHGLQRRRADGVGESAEPHPALARALLELEAFAASHPGALVEDKGLGVTLHYRRAPTLKEEAVREGERLAALTGLDLLLGDMIVELRTPGRDKGHAVDAFMDEAPFAGRTPIFLGDDVTDEDGFRAVAARGGYGVLVGPGRHTAARFRLDDVEAVLRWLEDAAGVDDDLLESA